MQDISIVIPTYNRAKILLESLTELLNISGAAEIIVVDQTKHDEQSSAFKQLTELHNTQAIKWLRIKQPSIPNAMNQGLLHANSEWVLFLDDDSRAIPDLLDEYTKYIKHHKAPAFVGQVLQPGETPVKLAKNYSAGRGIFKDLGFKFNTDTDHEISNCIACNLLVNRNDATKCGGFDIQFVSVAYRFETEFIKRLERTCGKTAMFASRARVNHLKLSSGGTRSKVENFLVSPQPDHSVGDYYFGLVEAKGVERIRYITKRFFSSPVARFYLRKPWWIPIRLVGEFRGLIWAVKLYSRGPRLITEP